MRRLLDYTRTGRWKMLTAESASAAQTTSGPDDAAARAPRQLDDGPAGHWIAPLADAYGNAVAEHSADYGSDYVAADDDDDDAHDIAHDIADDIAHEYTQQLCDATFFGLDVHELPAEKWQEIAPLFPR